MGEATSGSSREAAPVEHGPVGEIERGSQGLAFKDLAWARFNMQRALHEGFGDDRAYRILRGRFEAEEGHIAREYWAEHSAAGVVLTSAKPRRGNLLRMLRPESRYALHRSTESAGLPHELEAALADGDTLACKATGVLRGGSSRLILNRVFEAHKFLLSAVDAEMGVNPEWTVEIRHALREEKVAHGPPAVPAQSATTATP